MAKRILFTLTGDELNHLIAGHLLHTGHRLALVPASAAEAAQVAAATPVAETGSHVLAPQAISEASVVDLVEEAHRLLGDLDVCIHGVERLAEGPLLDEGILGEQVSRRFRSMFLFNREVSRHMMRDKAGSILFLLFHDALHYAEYPSSPVLNQGLTAMMRTMAKELSPFKVHVNALTLGPSAEPGATRSLRRKLEFLALKPEIPSFADLMAAVDLLIAPPIPGWTGQSIHTLPCGDALS